MASPSIIKASSTNEANAGSIVTIGSVLSSIQVANKDAKTAASVPPNPYKQLDGTATGSGNICVLTCPPNCTYFNMWCEWTGTISIAPTVTAFGEVAQRSERLIHPCEIDSSYTNPFTYDYGATTPANAELVYPTGGATAPGLAGARHQFDWAPLPALAESDPWTIAFSTTAVQVVASGSSRSKIITLNLFGARRIIVPISVAATGATKALIAGYFGR